MAIQLSQRVSRIKPSPTLAVSQKAQELQAQGKDVIGLGVGEPDFDTAPHIKDAAIEALKAGKTKYTAVDGIASLKAAICEKFERFNNLKYQTNQVMVSTGGKQCIYNLLQAVLNSGDEVIIPAPYWVSYPDMALLADAEPVFIETSLENRFKMTPEQLEKAITPKSKLLFLNSPSNPTGMAYSREELQALGAVLKKHPHVLIATDDMYEYVLWNGTPFCNIVMANPDLADRTFVLTGVSKTYAMTGWRIGYVAGPQPVIKAMTNIQSQSTSNPCSIAQAAAEAALRGPLDSVQEMVTSFKKRHDYVVEALNSMKGVECAQADGTFYAFPRMQKAIEHLGLSSDLALAERLLNDAGVAIVPGSAFGAPGYARLSFATAPALLEKAMDRLQKFFNGG